MVGCYTTPIIGMFSANTTSASDDGTCSSTLSAACLAVIQKRMDSVLGTVVNSDCAAYANAVIAAGNDPACVTQLPQMQGRANVPHKRCAVLGTCAEDSGVILTKRAASPMARQTTFRCTTAWSRSRVAGVCGVLGQWHHNTAGND